MQDLGYHEYFDGVDIVPEFGYTTLFVELIEGHVYAIYTLDGNFAKIQVRKISDDAVIFDGRTKPIRITYNWLHLSRSFDKECASC